LIFEYEKVVIGSSLTAVLYAFVHNYPIFFTQPRRPFRFDYLEPDNDVAFLNISSGPPKSLTTLGSAKRLGEPKEVLWERLLFLLGLDGKCPLSDMASYLRYDGNTVSCSNEYAKILEFSFQQCFYFGDPGATGFTQQKHLDEHSYICYDYIAFNKGGKHEIDYIHTGDDFVSEIWFYPSDRIDGNTPVRDACAVSKLTTKQLIDFDYSETMARFKLIYEMEKRGMKGTFAHGYTSAGNPKHYKFRTNSIRRETDQQQNESQPEAANIQIPSDSEKDLLQALPSSCVAYYRFLR